MREHCLKNSLIVALHVAPVGRPSSSGAAGHSDRTTRRLHQKYVINVFGVFVDSYIDDVTWVEDSLSYRLFKPLFEKVLQLYAITFIVWVW
jgi:hypothetical protein